MPALVNCVFSLFQITTSSLAAASVGNAYSASLASSGGASPYTYSLVSATPDTGLWITITGSGSIQGTPQTAEVESIVVQVTDSNGVTAQATLSLTVNNS